MSTGDDVEELKPLRIIGEMQLKWHSQLEKSMVALQKIKSRIKLPYDPAIIHLDIYSKELKARC